MSTEHCLIGILAFSGWDMLLVVAVSLQATALAYVPHPRWKAFLLTLPVPFTLASLSVGQPLDSTNVVALLLLLAYTYGVYCLHVRCRVPMYPRASARNPFLITGSYS